MEFIQKLMSGFRLDLGPLKEPLGFIRLLEWLFTIFAFATTGGYEGSLTMTLNCPDKSVKDVIAKFAYPFRLQSQPYSIPNCNTSIPSNSTFLQGDYSSSAEFYVSVGVFAFLYCTFTLVLYLGYQHIYRETTRGPIVDLVVTAIFAFLWLVSSSAWGKGLTDVKYATDPEMLRNHCTPPCVPTHAPSMGRLNSSVVFGFLNLILWAGNCWFIFKETPFHKPSQPSSGMEQGGSS
ncbi:synaptophysin-like protein 2a [Clarias gariepinus]|uniref:synaptophysin-like protein 2a n=1 Tax=Clarias gariepinus TaxID=13013 RepID=UPI00234C60F6|nr:synaptophysin-like protein 2a [Clarias gariepinus]